MSYEKQNFVDGQVLEAEHLNHIEEGLKELEELGGSVTIIDRASLPTSMINENAFYRVASGEFVARQVVQANCTCHCVDGLPEVGEPMMNTDGTQRVLYYNGSDGLVYAYYDENLAGQMDIPAGWYDFAEIAGSSWAGVITSIGDDPNDGKMRLLLRYSIYHYKGGNWTSLTPESVGRAGTASGAEVFNYSGNTASGVYSHAEGIQTTASGLAAHAEGRINEATGEASHAEGMSTEAVGNYSHSEGYMTDATGIASHVEGEGTVADGNNAHGEGVYTQANGYASHAEGSHTKAHGTGAHSEGGYTQAYGDASHAEGYKTIARGECQHVHGYGNIEDTEIEDDGMGRGKYITIVGNGSGNTRSNAHTLDWKGNAWFAGSVEGAKLVLRSPNGTKFDVTVDNNGNLNRGGGGSGSGASEEQIAQAVSEYMAENPMVSTTSWDELTNKLFGEETVHYQWNDEVEYSEVLPMPDEAPGEQYAKVSEDAPIPEFFVGKHFRATTGGETQELEITEGVIHPVSDQCYTVSDVFVVVLETTTIDGIGVTFTKGIWAMDNIRATSTFQLDAWQVIEPATSLEESVIPDTIARTADFVTEEWVFTLADGSTVTRKVVTAV